MKVGLLGYGEIGQAVGRLCAEFGEEVYIKELDRDEFPEKLDVLHVAIPNLNNFVEIVNGLVEKHQVDLAVIHSTVEVGTTEKIKNAVHSPVRGIHPNLYEGLKTFIKFIGADDPSLGEKAKKIFESYGLNCKVFNSSKTTELNKLLDTTYYGICIEAHRYFKKACDKFGVDFESVREFNQTYNEGYAKLGMSHVVRPVLYAPEGEIGGHCILPNARILEDQIGDGFMKKVFGDDVVEKVHRGRAEKPELAKR